jgi:hypothetical protein
MQFVWAIHESPKSSGYLGLTQKAALPLFECFAKQNLSQMRQKSPMSIFA